MTAQGVETISFIGAGLIGSQLARLSVATGYRVVLSNSRGPESLSPPVQELGGAARAGTVEEAAEVGDVVVVATPLKAYSSVPVSQLAGKIVIDTNNYYPARDGVFPELEQKRTTSSELLQAHLPTSHVVKAFNHIEAAKLTADALPPGSPDRRALAIAGDSPAAKDAVTRIIDGYGFDVFDVGSLAEGWKLEYPSPVFAVRSTLQETRALLETVVR